MNSAPLSEVYGDDIFSSSHNRGKMHNNRINRLQSKSQRSHLAQHGLQVMSTKEYDQQLAQATDTDSNELINKIMMSAHRTMQKMEQMYRKEEQLRALQLNFDIASDNNVRDSPAIKKFYNNTINNKKGFSQRLPTNNKKYLRDVISRTENEIEVLREELLELKREAESLQKMI